MLVLLVTALWSAGGSPARAAGPGGTAGSLTSQLSGSRSGLLQLQARADQVAATASPVAPLDAARRQMQIGEAGIRYRDAIRSEQAAVYRLAVDQSLGDQVLPRLGSSQPGLGEAVTAIRSQWVAYGTPSLQRRPNQGHRFLQSEPVAALLSYYRAAGGQLGIDWTYLGAINYVETDFGRNNGPSAAGAQGPMQFLPTTWDQVGGGGDIMSARDAIFGAARFLRQSGAPESYQRALFAYNNDQDYVDAVAGFAAALRADPLWLTRLYYWNTYG
ncbi:MAG: lytic transglycosylase domain-containing protein [Candidatus Dormibacteraeota bacterium]|nr:lytic transglycosylase domain-containing protein [Candidatus Dormibacteraeota bacterium]